MLADCPVEISESRIAFRGHAPCRGAPPKIVLIIIAAAHLDFGHPEIGGGCLLDRRGLEQRACECYLVIKKEYERLLPTGLTAARAPFSDRKPLNHRSRTDLPSPASLH